ncbi:substrate-binding domain-containing protein [Evansella cellulosilytica]|uniref:Transcriptional regulator, LacI family n=1 Tax=Evansella cellulosilytica (strain ATCC 21833 / DSM 2522 / FERM P-1141 / JCM 9156 / N-4) TaxID=649639 RepID=E6TTJ8_EVAC2|nr:substrate-binding domain-containing protein [Evansella cellulosilytica]ADU29634.1 transcriptional regulator, LacI family [Evansella cellulosilytica DSM 2522]
MKKTNVTMRDIADKLGVSNVTVSKALNDKEGVSDELKSKIKLLADEMGYRINAAAKSMKQGLSYNIGIIIPERFVGRTQSFYLTFYKHISKVLEERNYSGILHILSAEDEERLVLPRIYYENKVDGFILLGQIGSEYVEFFKDNDIPRVFLDFYTDQSDIDSVVTDNFYGVYEITNYLINAGHKDIAFVGNIYSTSSIQDRYLGYYKSLLEHRISLNHDYVIFDRNEKGEYIEFELPDPLPTSFVCNCDEVAYNLINKLEKLGYSVPDDFSIVGFDNDIYASISEPKLTTVAVDVEMMSKTAVDLVIEKIFDKDKTSGRVLVKGNIIYRDSVKTIKDKVKA